MVNMLKVLAAIIVLLGITGVAILGKRLSRIFIFRSTKTPNDEGWWLEFVSVWLIIILSVSYYVIQNPRATWINGVGAGIFFLGGFLQILCRKHLYDDRTFGERLASGFSAAQTGMYKGLRYPSATALILLLLGLALSMGSWWALGLFVILFIPSILYHMSQEEQSFLDQFGDRWISYRAISKKIIPKVL